MNLLIVEDDVELREYLRSELTQRGFEVTVCISVAQGLRAMGNGKIDIVILDRMLPDGDGLSFIEDIRGRGSPAPVLVLSALGDVKHRVEGLQAGGDDYLVKPFDIVELVARIEVLRRRSRSLSGVTELKVGELKIDLLSQRVYRAGRHIRLQPREFKLLEYLARHSGQVVTRAMLLEAVWDLRFDPQTNVVDVQISRLRNKLDADFPIPLLHTVRGEGYRLAQAG
ncbi:MAG: response regulator transcription factor [Gammaproteobacteria bacterium]|nr:response regulator transcription factor [Gammaproteobacteria bacterium]